MLGRSLLSRCRAAKTRIALTRNNSSIVRIRNKAPAPTAIDEASSYHWTYIPCDSPVAHPQIRSQKRRAFIAEDTPDVRASLALLLEHEGFSVVGTAISEFEAIDWLHNNEGQWELAIIDLLLQDGSGFNVVRHFKSSPHPGKVLVYSGFVTDAIRAQCEKLGADAVISKSDVQQLQRVLDAFRPRDDSRGDDHR